MVGRTLNRLRRGLATFEDRLCEVLLHPWASTTNRARAERSWMLWGDEGEAELRLTPLGAINGALSRLPGRRGFYVENDAGHRTVHLGRTVWARS